MDTKIKLILRWREISRLHAVKRSTTNLENSIFRNIEEKLKYTHARSCSNLAHSIPVLDQSQTPYLTPVKTETLSECKQLHTAMTDEKGAKNSILKRKQAK